MNEKTAAKNFQRFIRLRDAFDGGNCISCGKYIQWDKGCDAGHYISRRHKVSLFDEANCHAQCKYCNDYLHGNLLEYRKYLIRKIGLEKVEALEDNKNTIVQRKGFHYIALNEYYLKKCRDIKAGK